MSNRPTVASGWSELSFSRTLLARVFAQKKLVDDWAAVRPESANRTHAGNRWEDALHDE